MRAGPLGRTLEATGTPVTLVLEPGAPAFAKATAKRPFLNKKEASMPTTKGVSVAPSAAVRNLAK
jgi:hypothetical protein